MCCSSTRVAQCEKVFARIYWLCAIGIHTHAKGRAAEMNLSHKASLFASDRKPPKVQGTYFGHHVHLRLVVLLNSHQNAILLHTRSLAPALRWYYTRSFMSHPRVEHPSENRSNAISLRQLKRRHRNHRARQPQLFLQSLCICPKLAFVMSSDILAKCYERQANRASKLF
jgi:hypothetical protein